MQHLMLREDVVQACADGRFAVYPIGRIDEGVALLTGLEAGRAAGRRHLSAGSVNRRVEDRLRSYADIRRNFGKEGGPEARALDRS